MVRLEMEAEVGLGAEYVVAFKAVPLTPVTVHLVPKPVVMRFKGTWGAVLKRANVGLEVSEDVLSRTRWG